MYPQFTRFIISAGLIFVMMRRHKIKTVAEASLVTNEDEARAVNNQVVFQKGLKTSTTSSLQEHFNNHFGKVASHYFILYTLECLMSIPYCPALRS